jgi:putative ABC transport system substrate-binding protein
VVIELRGARDQHDQLPALAADLMRRKVEVICATGGIVSALAARAATTTIPIVFSSGADPVAQGIVHSLNQPGGNVDGSELSPNRARGQTLRVAA